MGNALGVNLEDRYYLQKVKLGEGSFGVVWRAREKTSNAIVAIKQIDKNKMVHRGATREDVLREIEMMKICKHPNVTELYDTFEDSTYISLALEYCDGGDFGDKVNERALNLQEHEAAEWARQICSAVETLHAKEICHRDIKPDNFMMANDQVKLCDFGLAVKLRPGELCRVRCGTPAFMAPELLRLPDTDGYGHLVDIWAAGITLYMLICGGKHPFIAYDNSFDEKLCFSGKLDFSAHDGFQFLRGAGRPPKFSEAPRALARRMVEPDMNKRICARSALEDPWLNQGSKSKPGALSEARAANFLEQRNGIGSALPGAPSPAFPNGPPCPNPVNNSTSGKSSSSDAVAALAAAAIVVPAMAFVAMTNPPEQSSTDLPSNKDLKPNPKTRISKPGTEVANLGNAQMVSETPPQAHQPQLAAHQPQVVQPQSRADEVKVDVNRHINVAPKERPRAVQNHKEQQIATIVMVGPTGQGKSTLGNMLAGGGQGFSPFKTSDDFDSETLDCAHADFSHDSKQHRAIDTIGFLDTRMDASENMDKFSCFADRAPAGIDAFLFVLKKGRFTEQSLGQLVAFRSIAGDSAMSYTILVFTHCGAETNESLRERCASSSNQHLKNAVDSCALVLGVDSLDTERCEDDRMNLLNAINDLVKSHNGVKYDNVALNDARERRLALKEKIETLSAERRDMMRDKMDALFNGRLTFEQVQRAVDDAFEHEERERKAAEERVGLQALLAAAQSEASAWKEVARNALRGSAGQQGSSLGLAGCCTPMPAHM